MKTTIEQMETIHHSGKHHFIITVGNKKYFQSYGSLIAVVNDGKVTLNRYLWNYSKTTVAYLNRFLGITNKENMEKRASGEYKLRAMDSSILRKLNPAYFS